MFKTPRKVGSLCHGMNLLMVLNRSSSALSNSDGLKGMVDPGGDAMVANKEKDIK